MFGNRLRWCRNCVGKARSAPTYLIILKIPNGLSVDDRVRKLKQVEKLEQEKSEIQGKLKKEKNQGTQVQLNTRIKQITDRIEAIKVEL